jgi:hypothetical protein
MGKKYTLLLHFNDFESFRFSDITLVFVKFFITILADMQKEGNLPSPTYGKKFYQPGFSNRFLFTMA